MAVADVEFSNPLNDKGHKFLLRRDNDSGESAHFTARALTDTEAQQIGVAINGLVNTLKFRKGEAEQEINVLKFRLERRAQALRMLLEVHNVGVTMGDEEMAKAYAPFFPGEDLAVGKQLILDGKLKNAARAQIYEGVTESGAPIKVEREMTLAEFWLSTRALVCDKIVEAVTERAKGERSPEAGKG